MYRLLPVLLLTTLVAIQPRLIWAQGVEEAIEFVNRSRSDSCKADRASITFLVRAIRNSSNAGEQAKGLQFLAQETFWEAEDQRLALGNIVVVGRGSDSLGLLASRALASARGELYYAVLRFSEDRLGFEAYLDQIITHNEGRNAYYQALARQTLAEQIQERLLSARLGSSVPYLDLSDEDLEDAERVIELYDHVRRFYTTSSAFSRDLSLDFLYQMALVDYVFALGSWEERLAQIAQVEGEKDIYDRAQEARHVFVYSFLRPPFVEVATEVKPGELPGTQDCMPNPASMTSTSVRSFGPSIVRKFFNPVQLVYWTCGVLKRSSPNRTIQVLASELAGFENRDYRIVLGHFRGNDVRLSNLSRSELVITATEVENRLSFNDESKQWKLTPLRNDCAFSYGVERLSPNLNVGLQRERDERGYVFIGSFLDLRSAKLVLSEVQQVSNFRGAYLIRPIID